MPSELSSTAKAILDEMDALFYDQEINLNTDIMVTPSRSTRNLKEFMNSPDLSMVTYRTAESTVTKNVTHDVNPILPPGMVISAEQRYKYSEEAIFDPTWLDSEEEDQNSENEENNNSFLSLNGSLLSAVHPESMKSRSFSFGSSISVGSCGFGKFSLSDGSISSVGSKPTIENILLDIVDIGKVHTQDWSGRTTVNDFDGDILYPIHMYDAEKNISFSDDDKVLETSNASVSEDDSDSEDQKSDYLPVHLVNPKGKKIGHPTEENDDKGELSAQSCDNDSDSEVKSDSLNGKKDGLLLIEFPIRVVSDDTATSPHTSSTTSLILNSPSKEPIMLMGSKFGLMRGDLVLSLFDCLGSRTRRKRVSRNTQNYFKWGNYVLQRCLLCARKIHKANLILSGQQLKTLSVNHDLSLKGLQSQQSLAVFNETQIYTSTQENCHGHLFSLLNNDEFSKAIAYYKESILNQNKDNSVVHDDDSLSTSLNLGIMYLMDSDYLSAEIVLTELMSKVKKDNDTCLDILILLGCAYYGVDDYKRAYHTFMDALAIVKKLEILEKEIVIAQIYNNIGCCFFEISSESYALKYIRKAFLMQKNAISHSLDRTNALHAEMILRLATIRGNMGYLHLRLKKNPLAISDFEICLSDQYMILEPNDEIVTTTLDHLAIAYLRAEKSDKALNVYSKILTSKINIHNGDHMDCATLLKKLNLLQNYGKNRKSEKKKNILDIYKDISGNHAEYERFEKLLKSI